MGNPLMDMFNGGGNGGNGGGGIASMIPMLLQMMKSGGNPSSLLSSLAQQNPQLQQMMNLIGNKSPADMEQICRQLCQNKGIDFDAAMSQVKNMMK